MKNKYAEKYPWLRLVPATLLVLFYVTYVMPKIRALGDKNYAKMKKLYYEDIEGVVTDISLGKSKLFLELNRDTEIVLRELPGFYQVIEIGDSISKHQNSDTIFIKNGDKHQILVFEKSPKWY